MNTLSFVVTAALALSVLGLGAWLGLALNRTSAAIGSRAAMRHMHFDD